MPQYHDVNNLKNGREVIITPEPLFRSLLRWWPYFVGDVVKFKLEAVGENEVDGKFNVYYLTEFFRNKQVNSYPIDRSPYDFEGRIIDGEGDVRYSVGLLSGHDTHIVMTAKVVNTDRFIYQIVSFIAGAVVVIIGIVLAWILG